MPGLVDFSEPRAPKNNWGPRIGIAYSPGSSGTTSVRAGFGISYDVLYDNIGILSLPPQLSGTIDTPFPPPDITNYLANGGIKPGAGGVRSFTPATPDCVAAGVAAGLPCQIFSTGNHIVVDQLSPKSIQWTLGVQHVFHKDYTVEVRYVGTRGIHLNTQERINRQPKTTATMALPTYTTNPGQAALDALTQMSARHLRFIIAAALALPGSPAPISFSSHRTGTPITMAWHRKSRAGWRTALPSSVPTRTAILLTTVRRTSLLPC